MSGEGPQWPRGVKSPFKWLTGRRSPRRTGDEAKTAVDSAQGGICPVSLVQGCIMSGFGVRG